MKRTWFLLVLLAVAFPAVGATDMYSWTDASGVKHFSDSPPPTSIKAHKLKIDGGVTTSAAAEEVQTEQAVKGAGPSLAAAAGYAPEDIKRNCDIARRNLATIQTQKPQVDADGYPVDPGAVKNQQIRIDKANQQITLFCAK